jgi:hypothetical protein
VEDVVHSLDHVSYKFLLELDLDGSIRHKQWVWDCHLDSFDILRLFLACVLIAVLHLKVGLFDGAYTDLVRHALDVDDDLVRWVLTWVIVVVGAWASTC